MKLKSIFPAYLVLWSLLTISASSGHAQVLVAVQNPSFTNLSDDQFAEMRQKWEGMSTPDLLKSAEADSAPAQYFYWARVHNQEYENCNRAFNQMQAAAYGMTLEQRAAAEAKWKTADDADRSKAAAAGDKGAEMVADFLEQGNACERAAKAFEWLKRSAEQGFPVAEFDAAISYFGQSGWVVIDVDQQKGLEYLQRAAEHDWTSAQYKLGMLYVAGKLLSPDSSKAIKYLQKAADKGGPRSQYELAQLYAEGIGEPRSTADSPVALLRRSATNGYAPAFHALAEHYRTGLGVAVDYVQAIRYYKAARDANEKAGADSTDSADDVFSLVDENLQPQPDAGPGWTAFARVLSVYLKATERSDANAMIQLGEWYLTGQFTPQDPVVAYYWFDRAANLGAVTAVEKRDSIKAKLRPEQLEQAAKLHEPGP
jgi:TPR repeat protein